MARALAHYGFDADPDAALERMAGNEMESMILHELGEAMAGEQLGADWDALIASASRTRHEAGARAVRDLLADCLSTLPALIDRADLPALHFHFATFDAPRRQMYPQLMRAYEEFLRSGSFGPLADAAAEGKGRWLAVARSLMALDPSARGGAIDDLLEAIPAPDRRPRRSAATAGSPVG
jgi:hypothetical protein